MIYFRELLSKYPRKRVFINTVFDGTHPVIKNEYLKYIYLKSLPTKIYSIESKDQGCIEIVKGKKNPQNNNLVAQIALCWSSSILSVNSSAIVT